MLRVAIALIVTFALTASAIAEPLTFLIDWIPSGDKAAVYLGVAKGLFKEQGLEITIRSGRGSSDVVTKLGTGAADVGMGGLSALLEARASSKVPVTAVMAIYTKQPDAIFTTAEAGIASLKDLEGKTVATATFSSANVAWPLICKANGVPLDSITLLKVDPSALAPMLATGRVAATINWLTVAPIFQATLNEAGKSLKVLPWSQYGYEGYGESLLASDTFIAHRPETLRKFLLAYAKAIAMANADPQAAAEALKAAVPEIEVARAAEQWQASVPLNDNEVSRADGRGVFEPGRLKTTWKWVAEAQGMSAEDFDPQTAVTAAYLPAPASGKVAR